MKRRAPGGGVRVALRCVSLKGLGLAAFVVIASLSSGPDPATAATLDVSWTSNTEADLAGYRLRLGTASGVYTQTIEAGLATDVAVDSLDFDVTYFLAVFAYDRAGNESAPSPEVSARVAASQPAMPVIESVVDVDSDSIYLMRGRPHHLIVRGRNIEEGASVGLGFGVMTTRLAKDSDGDLVSYVLIYNFASPGRRTLTIINPSLATTSASDAVT